MAGLADVAIVEADHAKAVRGQLFAEGVVPMDHLRSEPHDQQQRLGIVVAENLVADIDAIGAESLGRLMRDHRHIPLALFKTVLHGFLRQRSHVRGTRSLAG